MKLICARHGESEANAGLASASPSAARLTDLGRRQATELALGLNVAPDLIISSPYLRALETSMPTRDRFAAARFETWEIQEFTFLRASDWVNTTLAQRQPAVHEYWSQCSPHACAGGGAESFAAFFGRARRVRERLESLAAAGLKHVVAFAHEQFLQALRVELLRPPAAIGEDFMLAFRVEARAERIANATGFSATFAGGAWNLEPFPRALST
jgi:probable phosphoglycerate mutase